MFELTRKLALLSVVVIVGGLFLVHKFGSQSVADTVASTTPSDSVKTTSLASTSSAISLVATAPVAETDLNPVATTAYGVYTANGVRIDSLNENKHWPIASLTKLMTAVVARTVTLPKDKITIGEASSVVEGPWNGFSNGGVFLASDVEKAMLMVSSNVAAEAMARNYGREKFIDTMNSYAFKLGMLDTHFVDPSGLSYKNQSTVADLDALVNHILNTYPDIFTITKKKSESVYNYKTGKRHSLSNINEFAGRSDFIGGKTGTTPVALQNLISVFSGSYHASDKIIIILLGTEDRFNKTKEILGKL